MEQPQEVHASDQRSPSSQPCPPRLQRVKLHSVYDAWLLQGDGPLRFRIGSSFVTQDVLATPAVGSNSTRRMVFASGTGGEAVA